MSAYRRGYRHGHRDRRRSRPSMFWGRALVVFIGVLLFLHWAQAKGLVHP